ncbi:MAG: HAMP domain-containing sensor histidine kinase [Phycisphaerales bacterium]
MNPRRRITWIVYAVCVALLVHGLGWVSWQVVRLERAEVRARAENDRRDAERLALWRMDSLVAPLIARESARPYLQYRPFIPAGRTYEDAWQPAPDGAPLVASPLLTDPRPEGDPFEALVRLHFQVDPDGVVTSPEAPSDEVVGAAGVPAIDYGRVDRSKAALAELAAIIGDLDATQRVASARRANRPNVRVSGPATELEQSVQELGARSIAAERALNSRAGASKSDYRFDREQAPAATLDDAARPEVAEEGGSPSAGAPIEALADRMRESIASDISALAFSEARLESGPVRIAPFEPAWIGGGEELVFVRQVLVHGVAYRQGVWLDWPELKRQLIDSQRDLFPQAELEPILPDETPTDYEDAARRLAIVPARFEPGAWPAPVAPAMTPARWSLVLTWFAVLAAVVAIGVVLQASISLSDRRGRFVSAVTHELRTPLTTFRLYAGMLADGMVSDEKARAEYLDTLKRESGRLSGIVENVLEYARLSRRATGQPQRVGPVSPDELLVRVRPMLSRRAEQGGMDLIVSAELGQAGDRVVHVDPQSVERILTNLVDNACRYAAPDEDDAETRIHLDVSVRDGCLEFLVADYGPGVAPSERGRIFGEFRRGGAGARADRSGLGLGLALSRGLAREADGELRLVRRRGHGAEFLLSLPLHEPIGG